jgi:hypothetical protein
MLHPSQFKVNEAWIAFRLNGAPIRTERDGDFNCIALMDAASCFILSSELIPAGAAPAPSEGRRLLTKAKLHKNAFPQKLFVSREDVEELVIAEARKQSIEVVKVAEDELLAFTDEARQGFAERFGGLNA